MSSCVCHPLNMSNTSSYQSALGDARALTRYYGTQGEGWQVGKEGGEGCGKGILREEAGISPWSAFLECPLASVSLLPLLSSSHIFSYSPLPTPHLTLHLHYLSIFFSPFSTEPCLLLQHLPGEDRPWGHIGFSLQHEVRSICSSAKRARSAGCLRKSTVTELPASEPGPGWFVLGDMTFKTSHLTYCFLLQSMSKGAHSLRVRQCLKHRQVGTERKSRGEGIISPWGP